MKTLTIIAVVGGALLAAVSAKAAQYGDASTCYAGAKVSDPHRKIDFYSQCLKGAPMAGEMASAIFINRGVAYYEIGEFDKALEDFTSATKYDPQEPTSYSDRAEIERKEGRSAQAIADLEQALRLRPSGWAVALRLAWELATSPDPSARDGKKAKAILERAQALKSGLFEWDLIAAVDAELGEFDQAQKDEQKAIDLYKGSAESAAEMRARLALYGKGKAFHQEPVVKSGRTD